MAGQIVFGKSFFDIINMFLDADTEWSGGSTHILKMTRTFNYVGNMGKYASNKYFKFIFLPSNIG